MSYPNAIDANVNPGDSLRPPGPNESPGTVVGPPTGPPANPDMATWLQNSAASMIGLEQQVGLPSNPAPGSILATLQTSSAAPSDWVSIKSYGAKGDGVTDDSNAFIAFRNWAVTQTGAVKLVMPPGYYKLSNLAQNLFKGITKLTVSGYGATISTADIGQLAAVGLSGIATNSSARLASVNAGSNTVTCLTPAQAALFTVNTWAYIGAIDIMGYGAPQNHFHNEFVFITAINTSTGVITFSHNLNHTYLSTYPVYAIGNNLSPDQGGPATLYTLDAAWNCEIEFIGLNFSGGNEIGCHGRRVKFYDCTFTTGSIFVPSVNKEFIAERCDCTGSSVETDKACELVIIKNCQLRQIVVYSASIQNLIIHGCDITVLNGTGKNCRIIDCTINTLTLGVAGYGQTETCFISNSLIQAVTYNYTGVRDNLSNWTLSHGTLTNNSTTAVPYWAVPGGRGWLGIGGGAPGNGGLPFTITGITQLPGGNVVLATTLPNVIPTISPAFTFLQQYPVKTLTVKNCVGCPDIEDMSQRVDNGPLWSYSKRYYKGNLGTSPAVPVAGRLVQITINVIQPYTGVASTCLWNPFGQFGIATIVNPDFSIISHWNPVIDLKTVGKRVITPGAVTGLAGADSIASINASWLAFFPVPYLGTNLTDTVDLLPIVSVEIVYDQGSDAPGPSVGIPGPPGPPGSGGGGGGTIIDVFTTAGTFSWTPHSGATIVEFIALGAGAGGASGGFKVSGTAGSGGGGGGGGGLSRVLVPASLLGSAAISGNIGAGGPGGAAVNTSGNNGVNGTDGGSTYLGSANNYWCYGGGGKSPLSGTPQTGGVAGIGEFPGTAGGNGGGAGTSGLQPTGGAAGGGGGAGVPTTPSESIGGAGGDAPQRLGTNGCQGAVGAVHANGGNGKAAPNGVYQPGGSGGGGGSTTGAAAGGNGGNGGGYGTGGGGGGAALAGTSTQSGAGGAGTNGFFIAISFF